LRWNLFIGSETKSQVAAARFGKERAEALERDAQSGVRLQVRQAYLQLKSASERVAVSQEAVAQAESSHEIVRNRYDAGLTTVTELLRSDTALMGARLRRLAAIHDQRIAAANLEYAAGTLGPDSELLR
jgi:outer membrane protein TolC